MIGPTLGVAAVLALAAVHGRTHLGLAYAAAGSRLTVTAGLQAQALDAWWQELVGDITVLAASASVLDPAADQQHLDLWIDTAVRAEGLRAAWLLDAGGRVVASAGDGSGAAPRGGVALPLASAPGEVVASPVFLDGAVPSFDAATRAADGLSTLVFRLASAEHLDPQVGGRPDASPSAESFLLQRDGPDAVYLTPSRFAPGPPLSLRRPLSDRSLPAVHGLLGAGGVLRGTDYRGVEVLAVARPVPGTPWTVVAMVDRAEIATPALWASARDGLVLSLAAAVAWAAFAGWSRRTRRQLAAARTQAADRAYLGTIMAALDEAVIAVDRERRVTAWNPAAERHFGWTADEALGRSVDELIPFEVHGPMSRQQVAEALERDGVARFEVTARRKDGASILLESHLAVLRDAEGRTVGVVGVSRDTTATRRAREAVARSEAQLRLIAGRIPAGVFVSDEAGRNTYVNEGAAALAGLSVEEMLANGYARVVHPDDLATVAAQAAEVRAGLRDRIAQDLRFQRPDGRERWVHLVAMPFANGGEPGWIGVLIDLTEERRLSERAARAERLAGLGALAGGMAHRVNNPLAALLGSIRFALQEVRAGGGERLAEAAEALREAEEDGRRIAGIVKDLESFASPAAAGGVHDVRDVLHEAIRLAAPDLAARARLVEDLQPVPFVHGERNDLRQLFLHLLRNAWRSMPEGRPERHQVRVTTGSDERGWAVVEVRDDGAGMSASAARHAFEPFHGDRLDGSGGLGLSVCWGIATSLGGTIELESREGAGTRVRVALPPSAAAGPSPTPPPGSPRAVTPPAPDADQGTGGRPA